MATIDRVAIVIMWLYEGQPVTIMRVSEETGLTRQGAWYLLSRLSSSLHLHSHDGVWKLTQKKDPTC